jgi:DNA-binding CsgD family transcriptional regulator
MRITLEEFSTVVATIHAAAAHPERWPDAVSAVARLIGRAEGGSPAWERVLDLDAGADEGSMPQLSPPSVKRVVALLAPHVRTAKQLQVRLAEAQAGRLALSSLDRLAIAALIVTRAGTVEHLNASARSLIASEHCARIVSSRLRFNEVSWNTAFEDALRRATQSPPRTSHLPLSSTYELGVSPLEGDGASLFPCALPLALVVIARSSPDVERIAQRVSRVYGLTAAEARVMAALTSGATVEEIAAAHGVRTSTVRAQVRSLFEKTQVHRQSDLVRLALTGAPLLGGRDL